MKELAGYLTLVQAAAKLGRSRQRVQQWIVQGRLPAQKIGGRYLIPARTCRRPPEEKPGRPAAVA